MGTSVPTVFVSYSWDDEEHKTWVRQLATELTAAGVDVSLDAWQVVYGDSVTKFMEAGVTQSDFVLTICTPAFAAKADDRLGGAGYEQQIVSGHLLSGTRRSKFIPILRRGDFHGPNRAIPTHFAGTAVIDFRDDGKFRPAVEELLRAIYQTPLHARPPLGVRPSFDTPRLVTYTVDLSDDLTPLHGEGALSLVIHEALESSRQNELFAIKVDMESLRSAREAITSLSMKGNLSHADRERRRDLRDLMQRLSAFGTPLDAVLADVVIAIVKHIGIGRSSAVRDLAALTEVVRSTFAFLLANESAAGVEFEVFPRSRNWFARFHVDRRDAHRFAQREGVQLQAMGANYGLKLADLPHDVVRRRALPAIVLEMFRRHYPEKREPLDAASVGALDDLLVTIR